MSHIRLSLQNATAGQRIPIARAPTMRATPGGRSAAPGLAAPAGGQAAVAAAAAPSAPSLQTRTCRRCRQQFDPATNGPQSCRYHSALWTGGEISKALGFCRESNRPEHQLKVVVGKTGLIRFWDCCGADSEDAPGCCTGRHLTYDDPDD